MHLYCLMNTIGEGKHTKNAHAMDYSNMIVDS